MKTGVDLSVLDLIEAEKANTGAANTPKVSHFLQDNLTDGKKFKFILINNIYFESLTFF